MKKIYKIGVTWMQMGYLYIEAESVEEASEIAQAPDTELPLLADYLEDSFEIDYDCIEEVTERTCYCSMLGDKKVCGPGCVNER